MCAGAGSGYRAAMNTKTLAAAPLACALGAAALALASGVAEPDGRGAVEFDPLVITAPVAPLDRELLRLRLMLDAGTPCLGCDARAVPTRDTIVTGLIRFVLLPAEPPPRDAARQALGAIRCDQAGPGFEYRCP